LEEQYGRNRCKVDTGSLSLQAMPSRTLVAHPDNSRDPAADESKKLG